MVAVVTLGVDPLEAVLVAVDPDRILYCNWNRSVRAASKGEPPEPLLVPPDVVPLPAVLLLELD